MFELHYLPTQSNTFHKKCLKKFLLRTFLSSDRQHLSKRGDYQNCSVLYCVLKPSYCFILHSCRSIVSAVG